MEGNRGVIGRDGMWWSMAVAALREVIVEERDKASQGVHAGDCKTGAAHQEPVMQEWLTGDEVAGRCCDAANKDRAWQT